MDLYKVIYLKDGRKQSDIARTNKSPVEVGQYYKNKVDCVVNVVFMLPDMVAGQEIKNI